MPDSLYWQLTPPELSVLLEELAKRETAAERRAVMRVGVVAAAVYNNNPNRRRGARLVRPDDFVEKPPRFLNVAQAKDVLRGWAQQINTRFRKKPPKTKEPR